MVGEKPTQQNINQSREKSSFIYKKNCGIEIYNEE
jgi:hypothetical protein